MEMVLAIISAIVAVSGILWTVYRDRSDDSGELDERLVKVETKIALMDQRVETLKVEQTQMQQTLKNLESTVHRMDLHIARILTILEK